MCVCVWQGKARGGVCPPVFQFSFVFQDSRFPSCFFFKKFLKDFIFREGKEERKRGRETSMCGCLLYVPPAGDLVHYLGMCRDWESNR